MIHKIVQEKENYQFIFGPVGRLLVDKDVQKILGIAVNAEDGDVWFLSSDMSEGITTGFAVVHNLKNRNASHIKYLYAESSKEKGKLLKAIIKHLKGEKKSSAHTNDRAKETIWADFGFSRSGSNGDSFVKWEIELEEKKQ